MPPKLLPCIRFLHKVVHKIGRLRKFNLLVRGPRAQNEKFRSNRGLFQRLSGFETGHPAAAGPLLAFDFSVSDEQDAAFLRCDHELF